MVIQHTPHHMHFEIDFDTGKLLQLTLISLGVAAMFSLLFTQPAKVFDQNDISMQPTPSVAAQAKMTTDTSLSTKTVARLFSAQIDSGVAVREEDQPYYIPAPD
jgi:hypothetical protein